MSRYPLPNDEYLGRLIRDSYESVPGPDMRRLEQLERKLARSPAPVSKNRVNTLPGWVVLLLTGGLVAASWWVVDRYSQDPGAGQDQALEIGLRGITSAEDVNGTEVVPPQQPDENRLPVTTESPIIHQREQ